MTDEITIRQSMEILNGNTKYRAYPTDFKTDMAGTKGPSPGAVTVTPAGTDIDLTELASTGWCRIYNQDATNYVTFGIRDEGRFYPIQDVQPGEFQIVELSRFLGSVFDTGTGTATIDTVQWCVKAHDADCDILVEAFER